MERNLDSYKSSYDHVFLLDNELMLKWYPKRVLKHSKGGTMLELGLGHGFTALEFVRHFERYTVIEGSQEIIERFKEKYPNEDIDLVYAFFEDLEMEEKFDNIVMGFILEHVDDPLFILKKYRNYLKPGGSIFITVPNGQSLHRRLGYEAGLLDDMLKLTDADLLFGHKRLFSLDSLKELVDMAGYTIRNVEGLFLKPITTRQITELKLSEEILQAMLKVGISYPELCNGIFMEISIT